MSGEHVIRVHAKGTAYGGQDLWISCNACDWVVYFDTSYPTLVEVLEAAATHRAVLAVTA